MPNNHNELFKKTWPQPYLTLYFSVNINIIITVCGTPNPLYPLLIESYKQRDWDKIFVKKLNVPHVIRSSSPVINSNDKLTDIHIT